MVNYKNGLQKQQAQLRNINDESSSHTHYDSVASTMSLQAEDITVTQTKTPRTYGTSLSTGQSGHSTGRSTNYTKTGYTHTGQSSIQKPLRSGAFASTYNISFGNTTGNWNRTPLSLPTSDVTFSFVSTPQDSRQTNQSYNKSNIPFDFVSTGSATNPWMNNSDHQQPSTTTSTITNSVNPLSKFGSKSLAEIEELLQNFKFKSYLETDASSSILTFSKGKSDELDRQLGQKAWNELQDMVRDENQSCCGKKKKVSKSNEVESSREDFSPMKTDSGTSKEVISTMSTPNAEEGTHHFVTSNSSPSSSSRTQSNRKLKKESSHPTMTISPPYQSSTLGSSDIVRCGTENCLTVTCLTGDEANDYSSSSTYENQSIFKTLSPDDNKTISEQNYDYENQDQEEEQKQEQSKEFFYKPKSNTDTSTGKNSTNIGTTGGDTGRHTSIKTNALDSESIIRLHNLECAFFYVFVNQCCAMTSSEFDEILEFKRCLNLFWKKALQVESKAVTKSISASLHSLSRQLASGKPSPLQKGKKLPPLYSAAAEPVPKRYCWFKKYLPKAYHEYLGSVLKNKLELALPDRMKCFYVAGDTSRSKMTYNRHVRNLYDDTIQRFKHALLPDKSTKNQFMLKTMSNSKNRCL